MDRKKRVDMAQERALERIDYVLDYYAAPDFVEVVGGAGSDTVTLRIYEDGSVYER